MTYLFGNQDLLTPFLLAREIPNLNDLFWMRWVARGSLSQTLTLPLPCASGLMPTVPSHAYMRGCVLKRLMFASNSIRSLSQKSYAFAIMLQFSAAIAISL